GRSLAAGVALGLVADFRHDLFCYAALALAVVFAAAYFLRRARPDVRWRWLLAGVAIPLALLWIPTFAGAGIRQVVADLSFYQGRYVLPARETPWPHFFTLHHGVFPAFIGLPFPEAAFLTLVGPFLGLYLVSRNPRDAAALAVGAVSVAVIPQAAGRTDL